MSASLKVILDEIVNQLEAVATMIAAHEAALLQRAALQPGDIELKMNAAPARQELAKVRGWIAALPDTATIQGA
jgi:hypothetical protein